MSKYSNSQETKNQLRGKRIRLLELKDDLNPIQSSTVGLTLKIRH